MQTTSKCCVTISKFAARHTILLGVFCGALSISTFAHAQVADWTFETSVPTTAGPFSPETGAGSATGFHAASTVYSNPAGNGSSHSFSSTDWTVGDYYQFQVNTTGLADIHFSWDQTSSNTGPKDYILQYSTNGTTFTNFETYSVLNNNTPNPLWNATTSSSLFSMSQDLSAIAALDNASTVYFRLTDADTVAAGSASPVATAGTDRVDNVVVTGTPLATPEPSGIVLTTIGIASLMLAAMRRRRR
jgi:hypothetical protein